MPGEKYHQDGFNTLTSTADSAASLTVNASTAHRIWLYEINMGNVGTPADLTSIYLIGQVTDAGSSAGPLRPHCYRTLPDRRHDQCSTLTLQRNLPM